MNFNQLYLKTLDLPKKVLFLKKKGIVFSFVWKKANFMLLVNSGPDHPILLSLLLFL